jgi:hypothetical protein
MHGGVAGILTICCRAFVLGAKKRKKKGRKKEEKRGEKLQQPSHNAQRRIIEANRFLRSLL